MEPNSNKTALIIGGGPAGLTAAYELATRTDIHPILCEATDQLGGISRTVNYRGNRLDIGGHRFFSKSDRVLNWWLSFLPLEPGFEDKVKLTYHRNDKTFDPQKSVSNQEGLNQGYMLIRSRQSRIYFDGRLFSYPLKLSPGMLFKLGLSRALKIFASYLLAQALPRKQENNLEDFFINRFGRELYHIFFKDYTEKVWGRPCRELSAEWGAQRVKGMSIGKALRHALSLVRDDSIQQKKTETSLIEKFLYPQYGPGHLWEVVGKAIQTNGGTIHMNTSATRLFWRENKVLSAELLDHSLGQTKTFTIDYVFSSMPVRNLINGMFPKPPDDVKKAASDLQYRDFLVTGVLLRKLEDDLDTPLQDNWLYIQDKEVKVGRIQIFNNWSPFMVSNPDYYWLGLEYFCNAGDKLWSLSDDEIAQLAIRELGMLRFARAEDVLDTTVVRMPKAYPVYNEGYRQFQRIRSFTDNLTNLFLVGRNGMHRYNNQDHSMLTAMIAVDNIIEGIKKKDNIWSVNTEKEYHEIKT